MNKTIETLKEVAEHLRLNGIMLCVSGGSYDPECADRPIGAAQEKLSALIEQMEKQEPVAWAILCNGEYDGTNYFYKVDAENKKAYLDTQYPNYIRRVAPLFTTPQPAAPCEKPVDQIEQYVSLKEKELQAKCAELEELANHRMKLCKEWSEINNAEMEANFGLQAQLTRHKEVSAECEKALESLTNGREVDMHGFPDWFIFVMGYLTEIAISIAVFIAVVIIATIWYWNTK